MSSAPILPNDGARIDALRSYSIPDPLSQKVHQDLIELAALVCDAPLTFVHLDLSGQQWSASSEDQRSNLLAHALCELTLSLIGTNDLLEVADIRTDERLIKETLFKDHPEFIFYAAASLKSADGHVLGCVGVLDHKVRVLTERQRGALTTVAERIVDKLELDRRSAMLITAEQVNKKLLDAALSESVLHGQVISQAPVAIIIFRGADLVIDAVNPRMMELLGKGEDIIHQPLLTVMPELAGQEPYELLSKVLLTGETVKGQETEVKLIRSGKEVTGFYDFTYSPLIENGVITGVIDMAVEVTEQIRDRHKVLSLTEDLSGQRSQLLIADQKIKESHNDLEVSRQQARDSEDRFRLIADNIAQLAWLADAKGDIYWYNKRWYDYTGASFEEMKGWGWQKVHHPDHVEAVKRKIKHHFDTGTVWEDTFPLRDRHGNYQWFLSRAVPKCNEHGEVTHWFGTNTEITAQIEAREQMEAIQQELKESLSDLEQVKEEQGIAIAQAKLGTFSIDGTTMAMTASPRLKEIFGYLPNEDMPYAAAIAQIIPDDQDRIRQAVTDVFTKNADFDVEYAILGHHDHQKRWVKATGKLYRSEALPNGQFSGTLLDITQQKIEEQRKLDFIGIVSHELRSPLTSLNGYVQVLDLKAKKANDTSISDIISKAKRQVGRMSNIISGFLEVARMGESKIRLNKTRFDMAELVKAAEAESLVTITSHKVIYYPVEYTPVNADWDKIEQVVVNFVNNAVKYSPPNTTIHVACMTRNGEAHISVADEGMGIPGKDQSHIFERFYRVPGEHITAVNGFGIGLYISKEIVEAHGGRIGVESIEKRGSTFWFDLPVILEKDNRSADITGH